jgi:hypothetical protein
MGALVLLLSLSITVGTDDDDAVAGAAAADVVEDCSRDTDLWLLESALLIPPRLFRLSLALLILLS